MSSRQTISFPTARDSGSDFALSIKTDKGVVSGPTARQFLLNVMIFIEKCDLLSKLDIPFMTSGENYLLSYEPKHPSGARFNAHEAFESAGTVIYINTNHPRFFALRQGARLLEAAGLKLVG